ncbi:uncharacterized protein F4822DRAFT_249468 [Hypoxylon trugodes]|uniref:uncharacterized protein n=1 Tax=Hypoxylon trugodes TaxID=326681 RepID=UPI00218E9955|nr:uncharacterized protein F4822DRAFT_249468 [Hypoxylon trugodes]KAI1388538.1 hypothetical protein F4822DRAFT_249468 [Hypoxylon trugodes]
MRVSLLGIWWLCATYQAHKSDCGSLSRYPVEKNHPRIQYISSRDRRSTVTFVVGSIHYLTPITFSRRQQHRMIFPTIANHTS